jgi:hypothetical protein
VNLQSAVIAASFERRLDSRRAAKGAGRDFLRRRRKALGATALSNEVLLFPSSRNGGLPSVQCTAVSLEFFGSMEAAGLKAHRCGMIVIRDGF